MDLDPSASLFSPHTFSEEERNAAFAIFTPKPDEKATDLEISAEAIADWEMRLRFLRVDERYLRNRTSDLSSKINAARFLMKEMSRLQAQSPSADDALRE